MAKRASLKDNACPIARSMEAIGDCWSMLIIRDAMRGLRRFSEFQKSLGLAKNILTTRLRALVADGILATEPASDGSAYQDYVLTPKGRAVFPIMVALRQWGEEFAFVPGEATNIMVDRKTGKQVRPLELHAADGRLLGVGDTAIKPTISTA
jgi:DNA-binding HxlR family transcriptional regulator